MFTRDKGTIIIKDKKYYYKRNDAYVEILMEKIADLFKLHHAHYIPVTEGNRNYYISEDLNNIGPFITAYDAGIMTNNINKIKRYFTKYPNDFNTLSNDLTKMYFMDLLIENIDRNNDNWGFVNKDGKVELYILDNDLAFIDTRSIMTSLVTNASEDSILEIAHILKSFPPDKIFLFNQMFNELNMDTFERLIKETERDINMELPHKQVYISQYDFLRYRINKENNSKILKRSIY